MDKIGVGRVRYVGVVCHVGPAGGAVLSGGGHQGAEPGGVVSSFLSGNYLAKPSPEHDDEGGEKAEQSSSTVGERNEKSQTEDT